MREKYIWKKTIGSILNIFILRCLGDIQVELLRWHGNVSLVEREAGRGMNWKAFGT